MTRKIFTNIIVMSLITFLLCFVFLFAAVEVRYKQLVIDELKSEANCIAHALNTVGYDYLDGFESDRRISIISVEGNVIYDSDAGTTDNHSEREEIVGALRDGEAVCVRYSNTRQKYCIYYAQRLNNGSVLRLSAERFMFSHYSQLLYIALFALPLLMTLSAILARGMSRKIVKPINDIGRLLSGESYYEELAPLVSKLDRQNSFITNRISELRRRHEEFTAITENMSECFIVINTKGKVLSYNLAASRLLGIDNSRTEFPIDLLGVTEVTEAANEALEGRHFECVLNLNGSYYRVSSNCVMHDNSISGAVLVIIDITEKEMRYEMRREFTGNVSHELKTPLTSIRGAAEMMLSGIVRQEDINSFAQMIYDESSRLFSLVEDVLRLSELDEEDIEHEQTDIDLLDCAKRIADSLSAAAEKNKVSCSVSGEHAVITGVETMIDEIIFNLCDNAIKYNKPGGYVSIRVTRHGEFVTLSVADSGIGIPKEHLERIFERFYRVDKSRSRAIGGTGLGLSIVKHAAAYHNATLSLDSTEGVGSTFKVTFRSSNNFERRNNQ